MTSTRRRLLTSVSSLSSAFSAEPSWVRASRLNDVLVSQFAGRCKKKPLTSIKSQGGFITEREERVLRVLAERPHTRLSLRDLHAFCASVDPVKRIAQAEFLHRELPIRFASRALELVDLPYGLSSKEPVREAASWYASIVSMLLAHPVPTTEDEEAEFAGFLAGLLLDHACVPQALSRGVCEIRGGDMSTVNVHRLDRVLDQFFASRISMRFLIEHYIASHKNREGFSGVIQSECSPAEVAAMAAADTEALCRRHMGVTPEVQVYGSFADTFTFVPTHLYFILGELLKNSLRATVEHARRRATAGVGPAIDLATPDARGRVDGLPPIKVIISRGKEDIAIKVADEGGGIRRSELQHVWSYMYSSAPAPSADQFGGAPLEHMAGRIGGAGAQHGGGGGGSSAGIGVGAGSGGGAMAGGAMGPASAAAAAGRAREDASSKYAFAGYGMGLPLSRLYAQYFGGTLKLRPMEGFGTDAYLHLNRLRTNSTERKLTSLDVTLKNMRPDGRSQKSSLSPRVLSRTEVDALLRVTPSSVEPQPEMQVA